MRYKPVLLLIAACAAAIPLAAAEPWQSIPKVLREIDGGTERILFVSASEALTPTGELRRDLFPAETSIIVGDLLRQPVVDGCIKDEEHFYSLVNLPHRDSIDTAAATAEFVVEGVVDAREYGFHGGEPGQLLRLEQLHVLRGSELATEHLYVFLPVGRFQVGSATICKTDRRYAAEPALGDRVVALVLPNMIEGEFADVIDAAGLVTVHRNGTLSLPTRFNTDDAPRTLDALRVRIDKPHLEKQE